MIMIITVIKIFNYRKLFNWKQQNCW